MVFSRPADDSGWTKLASDDAANFSACIVMNTLIQFEK